MENLFIPVYVQVLIITFIFIFALAYLFRNSLSEFILRVTNVKIKTKNKTQETEVKISSEKINHPQLNSSNNEYIFEEKNKETNKDIVDLYELVKNRKIEESKVLFKELYEKENNLTKKEKISFLYDYFQCSFGINMKFSELEHKYINTNSKNEFKAFIYRYLSELEEKFGDFQKAIDYINKAIEYGIDSDENPKDIVKKIRLLQENNVEYNLQEFILNYDSSKASNKQKYTFFKELYDLLEENDAYALRLLEYGTQYALNDSDALFYLAYRIKNSEKQLYYYKKLLEINTKEEDAMNNIGVACNELGLDIKAIEYYKKSKTKGNTLAGANMGYKLLNAGFEEEVTQIINTARDNSKYHNNIDLLQTALNDKLNYENEKFNKIIEKNKIKNQYLKKAGIDYINKDIFKLRGIWKDNNSNLRLEIVENENNKIFLKLISYDNYVYISNIEEGKESNVIQMKREDSSYISIDFLYITIVKKTKNILLLIEKGDNLPDIKKLSILNN